MHAVAIPRVIVSAFVQALPPRETNFSWTRAVCPWSDRCSLPLLAFISRSLNQAPRYLFIFTKISTSSWACCHLIFCLSIGVLILPIERRVPPRNHGTLNRGDARRDPVLSVVVDRIRPWTAAIRLPLGKYTAILELRLGSTHC